MRNDTLKKLIKPVLGLGLLLLVVSQLQAETLKDALAFANWWWFLLGLMLAVAANVLCALRWRMIVGELSTRISRSMALKLYFQGVMANTVLPGGIIGGDIWRTLGLSAAGETKTRAAQTVFLDRVSGFWSLSLIAVAAFGLGLVNYPSETWPAWAFLYALAMAGIALAPLALIRLEAAKSRVIFRTALISLCSQGLTVAAFLACLMSIAPSIPVVLIVALCAGIFLGAVVPASIGGFGSREVASLFLLSWAGLTGEAAVLGSVLFGLTATIQGLGALLIWVKQGRPESLA